LLYYISEQRAITILYLYLPDTFLWTYSIRVKFGAASAAASSPGAQEGTPDEMTAASRLKFGEHSQSRPGAQDGSFINTSDAERIKVIGKCPFFIISMFLILTHVVNWLLSLSLGHSPMVDRVFDKALVFVKECKM